MMPEPVTSAFRKFIGGQQGVRPLGLLRLGLCLLDPIVVAGMLMLAVVVHPGGDVAAQDTFQLLGLLLLPVCPLAFGLTGCYADAAMRRFRSLSTRVLVGFVVVVLALSLLVFFMQIGPQISRLVVLIWLVATPIALCLLRGLALLVIRAFAGRLEQRVLVVGDARSSRQFIRHLERHPETGLLPVALCSSEPPTFDLPYAPVDDCLRQVKLHQVQLVVICASLGNRELVQSVMVQLQNETIDIELVPDLSDLPVFCLRSHDRAGQPVMSLCANPMSDGARIVKWIEDRVLGAILLAVSLPVMALVAIAIKRVSPGPVFFVQDRHGLGQRVIRVLKFRTMHHRPPVVAEELPSGSTGMHPAVVGEQSGGAFPQAVRDDPRVFPLGRFLRRTSLDELPQFFNVLRGDMSIVGPRPHAVQHNHQFSGDVAELMRRHYVKPGITGLAQISGARGEIRSIDDMRRRIAFDLHYIRDWSLWLDLSIIARTVLKGFINHEP